MRLAHPLEFRDSLSKGPFRQLFENLEAGDKIEGQIGKRQRCCARLDEPIHDCRLARTDEIHTDRPVARGQLGDELPAAAADVQDRAHTRRDDQRGPRERLLGGAGRHSWSSLELLEEPAVVAHNRMIFSRPCVTAAVALRRSTTSRACATTHP